jgi:hypothetical protein
VIERVSVLQRATRVAGDPHLRRLVPPCELSGEPLEPERPVECPERHGECRVEFVQMPAQPLLAATPLGDEVVTVVDQQLQLMEHRLARTGTVQRRLLQRGPCNGERIDPIRLAPHAAATPLRCCQPWRHPHQPLTRPKQRPLQTARYLPAILDRPQQRLVQRLRPSDNVIAAGCAAVLSDRASKLVDRDGG